MFCAGCRCSVAAPRAEQRATAATPHHLPRKFCGRLAAKASTPFAEIPRVPQPTVALAFEPDGERQRGVLDIVQQFLGGANSSVKAALHIER
jgi:hypothetical protein